MAKSTSAHIAIIGAGIMGLSTAYTLSRRGYNITLYDKAFPPCANASFMAGGMLAPYSEIEHMSEAWLDAGFEGISQWQNIATNIQSDIEFSQRGSLLVAHEADHYVLERFISHVHGQEHCEVISTNRIQELEPELNHRFAKGLFLQSEAHLHPRKAISALLSHTPHTFRQEEAKPYNIADQYDYVIDCRGFGAENEDKSLRGVKGEVALVHNPDFALNRPVRLMHPRYPLYIVPRADNLFIIGATNIESADTHNTKVSVRSALELLSALYSLHPSFADAQIVEIMAGIRPSYPDNLPRIKQEGNVIHCNGLFRHGFLLAPVMAMCAADMIEGIQNKFTDLFTGTQSDETDY
jgi:glycine oxidase